MELQKRPSSVFAKIPLFLIGGLILTALILIVGFAIGEGKKAKEINNLTTYSGASKDKPQVEVSSFFTDLGNITLKDERKTEFILENRGVSPLQLFKISSSCGCTFGQITIGNNQSPEFNMHSQNNWVGSVEPGTKATLTVIYRPFIMPVRGPVTRDVYVQTNDPQKSRLTFTVKANVE